jgi:hypothetical protein
MKEKEEDIRIYTYDYGSLKKAEIRIPGRKRTIHKCKSILEAYQCIEVVREKGRGYKEAQFILVDYTEVRGGRIISLDG